MTRDMRNVLDLISLEEIKKRYIHGETLKSIAGSIGVKPAKIIKCAHKNNIKIRKFPKGELLNVEDLVNRYQDGFTMAQLAQHFNTKIKDVNQLKKLYKTMTQKELARYYGTCKTTITNTLKRYNIKKECENGS